MNKTSKKLNSGNIYSKIPVSENNLLKVNKNEVRDSVNSAMSNPALVDVYKKFSTK
jgi:hypothetical protein